MPGIKATFQCYICGETFKGKEVEALTEVPFRGQGKHGPYNGMMLVCKKHIGVAENEVRPEDL